MLLSWFNRSVFLPKRSSYRHRKTLILFLSGAGGWVMFDKRLIAELNSQGFDVLGMNTLRYFLWRARSPEELTAVIQSQLQIWMPLWRDESLVMIGYSQGADVLPFVTARLHPAWRNRTKCLVLLGPARHADFHLRLRDVICNSYSSNALALEPELKSIGPQLPVLCIAGEKDPNASWWLNCRLVPGSHIFRHNAPEISRMIQDEIESVT
ncbi:MAG TPA: AcvB/VirJ family lysyl-phosphatidylglycerol hydrolase [Oligoflexus sp.]|uniref:AcvB/VirJ family lysyl-phosphatidylglycerol hydrolase n=1 Tax=Oligoflexus sp. TaxID=1971216 RepID=UPI002D8041F9|nr:AcvB/VirJ family lysyl-phosphatidylglycerol hydrolase [Oligoflexus sp.]HET9236349.1 AcvB/VirJ family lysyl-phosphatidylglycerol hydrolase [Oligoflexus sp.]